MPPRRNRNSRLKCKEEPADPLADCLLPQRILDSILCRLPAKSLVRFKRVCRPWSNLLTDPSFINMHYNHSTPSPKTFKSLTLDLSKLGLMPTNKLCRTNPAVMGDVFLASCKGMVCIGRPLATRRIILWNPATRLFKVVPDSKEHFGGIEMASLGLGCNDATDDYKVVRFSCSDGRKKQVAADVYSSKSDSWRNICLSKGLGHSLRVQSVACSVTVKGNPHWFGYDEVGKKMTLFKYDSTLDSGMIIDVRPEMAGDGSWSTWVDWEDQLGRIKCVRRKEDGAVEFIDVWVYDEDVNKVIRKVRLGGESFVGENVSMFRGCNWKNGVIIVECKNGEKFAFERESGSLRALEVKDKESVCSYKLTRHEESLGYIQGMTELGFREKTQINDKCSVDGFLASITRRRSASRIQIRYCLRF